MATSATKFSYFLLIVLYASSQQFSEARKSSFLSKYIHLDDENTSPSPAPTPITSQISNPPDSAPIPAPAQAPAPAPESFDSYTYKTTYTVDDADNEKEDEEFSSDDQELGSEDTEKYSNEGHFNSFSNSAFWGYQGEPQGVTDTRVVDNDNGKNYYNSQRDTRLVDNDNDNDNSKYYYNRQRQSYTPRYNEEGYYYTNGQKSRYEFDSIEEYEKQEGYPDVQPDHFLP